MLSRRFIPLHDYFSSVEADEAVLTFAQIEEILGVPLPGNAHLNGWWNHTYRSARAADAWRAAGFTATLLPDRASVRFRRER